MQWSIISSEALQSTLISNWVFGMRKFTSTRPTLVKCVFTESWHLELMTGLISTRSMEHWLTIISFKWDFASVTPRLPDTTESGLHSYTSLTRLTIQQKMVTHTHSNCRTCSGPSSKQKRVVLKTKTQVLAIWLKTLAHQTGKLFLMKAKKCAFSRASALS